VNRILDNIEICTTLNRIEKAEKREQTKKR
jgi:hypothetical protein